MCLGQSKTMSLSKIEGGRGFGGNLWDSLYIYKRNSTAVLLTTPTVLVNIYTGEVSTVKI